MTGALVPQHSRLVPKQDTNRIPNCQKCGQPMVVAQETSTHWAFGCERCQCAHVFSKPQTQAAAQYRVQVERQAEAQARRRAHEARPKYFILGGK